MLKLVGIRSQKGDGEAGWGKTARARPAGRAASGEPALVGRSFQVGLFGQSPSRLPCRQIYPFFLDGPPWTPQHMTFLRETLVPWATRPVPSGLDLASGWGGQASQAGEALGHVDSAPAEPVPGTRGPRSPRLPLPALGVPSLWIGCM